MASPAPLSQGSASHQMLIGGALHSSSVWLDVVNPATGKAFTRVPRATAAQLEAAVAAAKQAFPRWSKTSMDERRKKLLQLADRIHEATDRIAKVLTTEQGKTLAQANVEAGAAEAFCRYFAAAQFPPVEVLDDTPTGRVEVHRRPLGVVACIAPWNFPFLIAVYKMAPAVLAGNTIILKPAPTTPVTTLMLGEMAQDLFPPGVVNTLVDNNDLAPLLTAHKDIAKIAFTGSTATGKKVMGSAATGLKRVTLELGGNDAAIVLDDADPKKIAPKLFDAAFLNSGQVCIAIKRLYVHDKLYDALCAELATLTQNAIVGDGADSNTHFGPLQNKMQFDKVQGFLTDARTHGKVVAESPIKHGSDGYFVPITLVRDIKEGTRIVDEEQFGPILPVIRYTNVDDVIRRANDSPYGLGASVWSSDLTRAHDVARQIDSGTVWINQHLAFGPHIPFGGAKESGIGVEWGREGLLEYTGMHVINIAK
jgi:acyl-CoA reductase-like NAD-dependent aldehyde dehydrogenase